MSDHFVLTPTPPPFMSSNLNPLPLKSHLKLPGLLTLPTVPLLIEK